MDTHHPYNPPPEYLDDEIFERFQSRSKLAQFTRNSIKSGGKHLSDSELSDVTAVYNACCEYLHDSIVEFISTLKSAGQFDPSEDIFVLTADHGECLSPQKYSMMGHTPPAFFEEILHVPLAISRPDWDQTVVDDQVSLIDIFPTVLDAANISIPKNIDGNACSSPEKMGREHTRAVAKSGNKTYHSLRRDDGWKLSGSVRNGVDEMILSRYNVDTSSDEEIVYTTTDGQAPNDTECANVFRELQILRQSEGFIQDGSMGFEHSKIKEEHLKDLGYL
jgi:arylsulfatase A-like enzyme